MNPRHRRLLIPGLLVFLLVVVLVAALIDEARAEAGVSTMASNSATVCTMTDERIDEASGMAASAEHDDLAYVINDSGSAPAIHAVQISTCEVVGVTTVSDVAWRDPEALALGGDGTLWVADTGDNRGVRDDAALYSLPEPGPGDHRVTPTVHPVAYDTGNEDVEALLVDPVDGHMWLITKGVLGGELLELPAELSTDTANVAKSTGISMPIVVTDAAMTPDGRHALVRTYITVTLYDAHAGFDEVRTERLPLQRQGETITVEPGAESYLIGSEGVGEPLYRLPLDLPVPSVVPTDAAEDSEPNESTADTGSTVGDILTAPLVWVIGAAVVVAVGGFVVKRTRRPT